MKKAISLFLALAMLLSLCACGSSSKQREYDPWPTGGLGAKLPKPNADKTLVYEYSTLTNIDIYEATTDTFTNYIASCESAGFTIEAKRQNDSYEAYNAEGCRLDIKFYKNLQQVSISIYESKVSGTINWPTIGLATLLPVPNSTIGKIETNSSTNFSAYVGEIPEEEYTNYVQNCIEIGFTIDYEDAGTFFTASNANGVELYVSYEGFKTMYIDLKAPENGDTSVDESEDDSSLDTTPVDGTEYEADDFKYVVLSDGTIELTKYIGNESSVTISSEIDDYEVSRIGASAFEGCAQIENIIMWPDVISIGKAAFKGCSSLEDFSIPSSVTIINDSVFENCTSLKSIIIWGDVTIIGEAAFKNCTSLEDVSIPSSCLMIGKSAFEGCSEMEDVIFWGGEAIGDCAFMNCSSLKDISLPSEVTSVGQSAFEGCTSLESVIVWGDDVNFGVNAFANCPKLKNLPEGAVNDSSVSTDNNNTSSTDGIRPEFKEAMDSYEEFFDEYVAIAKKYIENPTDTSILTDYAIYMGQYAEMMQKFEAWENEDLNKAELAYYIDVQARITKKLLEIA